MLVGLPPEARTVLHHEEQSQGRTRGNRSTFRVTAPHLPLAIVVASDDNSVPQGIYLGPPVVHDSRQPGVNGFGAVAVTISQQLLIDSNSERSFTQLRKAANHLDASSSPPPAAPRAARGILTQNHSAQQRTGK